MIVNFGGGLGNQMFMYAFAKALQMEGCEVIIDGSAFNTNGGGNRVDSNPHPRHLEIEHFNISMPITRDFCVESLYKKFDARRFWRYHIKNKIRKLRGRKPKTYSYRFLRYESPQMLEDKNLIANSAKLPNHTYFCGCFQHLHCFSHIAPTIRKEFTLKTPLNHANQVLKNRILNTKDATFLHIRRGDYMQIPHFIKLATGYYNGALRAILARVANPHIFVFSDDMDFAEKYLLKCLDSTLTSAVKWDFVKSNNENNAACEMELMRVCQNAIIANSTFSWWAAYLIDNPRKVVVMPNRFFYDDTIPKVSYIKPNGYIEIDYNWGFEV